MDKKICEIRLQQWVEIIREANESGMTKKDWCAQHGISTRKFQYWQKKVRELLIEQGQKESQPSALPETNDETAPEEHQQSFYEITLSGSNESAPIIPDVKASVVPAADMELSYQGFKLNFSSETVTEASLSKVLKAIRYA